MDFPPPASSRLMAQHGRIGRLLRKARRLHESSRPYNTAEHRKAATDVKATQHGKVALWAVIQELKDAFETHFDTEEALMREHGYQGVDQHAIQHELLRNRLAVLDPEDFDSEQVVARLEEWFELHEATSDREFMEHLAQARGPGQADRP